MNILLVGCSGKMGERVLKLNIDNFNIFAGIDKYKKNIKKLNIYQNFEQLNDNLIKNIDIVVDFALPAVLKEELMFCIKYKKPLVICATGHTKKQEELINKASKIIPIFKTTNTSLGIALINKVIKENLALLKKYEIAIIEKHHKHKKDAPSGTAKTLLSGLQDSDIACYSIRACDIVGEHEILLFDKYEQLFIKHIALDKMLFAESVVPICYFLQGKCNGLYNMENYLNFVLNNK